MWDEVDHLHADKHQSLLYVLLSHLWYLRSGMSKEGNQIAEFLEGQYSYKIAFDFLHV